VGQGGHAFGDGPDPFESQGIDRRAAEGGQDHDAVALPVAVGVFPLPGVNYVGWRAYVVDTGQRTQVCSQR